MGSITIGAGSTDQSLLPPPPNGYEWVLLPERPQVQSPGEKGHYSSLNPEPIQISEAWNLDGLEHSALKYLARYKKKGGIEDLKKVKFFCDRMIAREIRDGNLGEYDGTTVRGGLNATSGS